MALRKLSDDHKSSVQNLDFHKQSFYKIIFHGTINSGVRIPPSFLKHMERNPRGNVVLKVSSRGKWLVKLLRDEDGGVFLGGDGWERFFRENYLEITNLLIFKYHGNLEFSVDVYDDTGFKLT